MMEPDRGHHPEKAMAGGVFRLPSKLAICHALPKPAAKPVRHFLRHLSGESSCFPGKTANRNDPTRGAKLWLKVAARDRTKPQSDESRSAAWSFDGHAVLTVRGPATSCEQSVSRILSRFLSRLQKRTLAGSQGISPALPRIFTSTFQLGWLGRRQWLWYAGVERLPALPRV